MVSADSDSNLLEMMFFRLLKLFLPIIFYQIHSNFQGREINVGKRSSQTPLRIQKKGKGFKNM